MVGNQETRLKSYNVGANLQLRDHDLVIAQVLPPSRGVHVVRLIVEAQGAVEFGEYMLMPGADQQLQHRHLSIDHDDVVVLRDRLKSLAAVGAGIGFASLDCDFSEYEEPERRLLRFRDGDEEVQLHCPSVELFEDLGLDRDLGEEYARQFETTWNAINQVLTKARSA